MHITINHLPYDNYWMIGACWMAMARCFRLPSSLQNDANFYQFVPGLLSFCLVPTGEKNPPWLLINCLQLYCPYSLETLLCGRHKVNLIMKRCIPYIAVELDSMLRHHPVIWSCTMWELEGFYLCNTQKRLHNPFLDNICSSFALSLICIALTLVCDDRAGKWHWIQGIGGSERCETTNGTAGWRSEMWLNTHWITHTALVFKKERISPRGGDLRYDTWPRAGHTQSHLLYYQMTVRGSQHQVS